MLIQKNFPLSKILWYKIGGKAKYLLTCENESDIKQALKFVSDNNIAHVVICGLGSNIIFQDQKFDGVVIRVSGTGTSNNILMKDNLLTVFGGTILDDVIKFSFNHNLIGLEWAGGLPGTVGAGIRGNVGAFGQEIKDSVYYAEVIEYKNQKYEIKKFSNKELKFAYRDSLIKKNSNMILVSAVFKLRLANQEQTNLARQIYQKNIEYRKIHHPVEYPTCGSVFKNITNPRDISQILQLWPDIENTVKNKWHNKVSMGYIINRLGYTGKRIGNMQISEKHSNFIVNLGKGNASDALHLIKEIKEEVYQTFGFIPETEVEIIASNHS